MFKRGKDGEVKLDPPHLLLYFGILVVVILVVVLITSIDFGSQGSGSSGVEDFKEQIEGDLNPSLISGNAVKEYELPNGYDELCFVDVSDVDAIDIVDVQKIQTSVLIGSQRNVFLFGNNREISFYVEDLNLPVFPYYNCAQAINGKVELKLSSNGQEITARLPVNVNYCKNAQEKTTNDGRTLCDFLDSVYYRGYKGECCSDHGYCC